MTHGMVYVWHGDYVVATCLCDWFGPTRRSFSDAQEDFRHHRDLGFG